MVQDIPLTLIVTVKMDMSNFDTSERKDFTVITEEEKKEIIEAAVERMLLSIPEVIGNLLTNHAALHKMNSDFYKAHPEFAKRKDVVQSVVEMIEGKNPLASYEDILEKAVPEISRRISVMQDLDTTNPVTVMPRDFRQIETSNNGVI